ncbi:MAG TPA: CcoQ/FixQ family Cbb3-type cytochrome c oxidase assembly chaperone [Anaeromyxobacteraceae bacterium]|nr:CcoQ/FixQ family Cbb3-type cytochrome c oxidase assembly chaperone [Anaeromyxobacteraceae bacterium]
MTGENAYLLFGGGLCAALVGIIVFYYSKPRKERVEKAKYEMLKDDDDDARR